MAPFVKANRVGIAVDSLRDIGKQLRALSKEDYAEMKTNALRMSKLLAEGHFAKQAFTTAVEELR